MKSSNIDFEVYFEVLEFCQYLSIYYYLLFVVSLFLFLLLLYLILFQTPKEISRDTRIFLLIAISTNMFSVFVYVLWQPVLMIPYFGAFSYGPLKNLGKSGTILGTGLWALGLGTLFLSNLIGMLQKACIFEESGRVWRFFKRTKNLMGFYLVAVVVTMIVYAWVIIIASGHEAIIDEKRLNAYGEYGTLVKIAMAMEVRNSKSKLRPRHKLKGPVQ